MKLKMDTWAAQNQQEKKVLVMLVHLKEKVTLNIQLFTSSPGSQRKMDDGYQRKAIRYKRCQLIHGL